MLPNRILLFRRTFSNVHSKLKNYKVGDKVTITRKITKSDLEDFVRISGDSNPIHLEKDGDRPVVHGAFLNSIVSGVIGTRLPGHGTLVVKQSLNFPNKCYVEEEIKVSVILVEDRKIIKLRFSCEVEKENKIVLDGDASVVLNK